MGNALVNGDVVAVKAWNTLGNQAAVNTYNFDVFGVAGGGITDQDFLAHIASTFALFYTTIQSVNSEHNGLQLYFVRRSAPLPHPVFDVSGAGPGLQPQAPIPRNTAPILKYSGFNRGPSGRGRVFLPFVSSVFLTALGEPDATLNTAIDSFAAILLAPFVVSSGGNSASLIWSLVGRPPAPAPITTQQIVSAQSAGRCGQMHKRGDYGRANASPI